MGVDPLLGFLTVLVLRLGKCLSLHGVLSVSTTLRPAVENNGNDQFYSSQLSLTVPTAH